MQDRRAFLKQSCTLCAGIVGLGALASQLSSCSTMSVVKTEINNGMISVPMSSFTDTKKVVVVRNAQLEFDIALVKNSNSDYTALQMKCTHQDNALSVTETGLFCASHGSAFDLKGNVTQEPAQTALKKYSTELNDSFILINTKS